MVTLRLTRKLQKLLDIDVAVNLLPTTSKLGDWYANIIPTNLGDLILALDEKTLLSIAIPIWESDHWFALFQVRLGNLLRMIGIPPKAIVQELYHYNEYQLTKTRSRIVLGSMNDIAYQYQVIAEMATNKADLSLSDAEYRMSKMPCKPISYRVPMDVAKDLLGQE